MWPMSDDYRVERDTMGEVRVPAQALYQAQTQRAVENFPISGRPIDPALIAALGLIKGAAAQVNAKLGVLDTQRAEAIVAAARSVAAGEHDREFPIDVFQTGSGTSSNMNANEVIASIASQALGDKVHPNDHVNASQSSNDVFPSAIHIAATQGHDQVPDSRAAAPRGGAERQGGRVRRGGEERPYAPDGCDAGDPRSGVRWLTRPRCATAWSGSRQRCPGSPSCRWAVRLSAPGSTPLPASPSSVISIIVDETGLPLTEARDHFEAQGARDGLVEASGALRTIAVSLTKIANDLRWMGSGPTAGLGEIALPDLQPGSSIMPGKVNPVICEATLMVCAQVIGNDAAVTFAGSSGNFELNVMLPVIARNVLESVRLLTNVSRLLADRCVAGIEANVEHCRTLAESSPSIVTPLNRYIGYENAAAVAKKALKEGKTIRQVVIESGFVDERHADPGAAGCRPRRAGDDPTTGVTARSRAAVLRRSERTAPASEASISWGRGLRATTK